MMKRRQCSVARKHTSHFQKPVSQRAFSVINMSNDAEIPDPVHGKLGHVNTVLERQRKGDALSH